MQDERGIDRASVTGTVAGRAIVRISGLLSDND
jgi:hypothetical protein